MHIICIYIYIYIYIYYRLYEVMDAPLSGEVVLRIEYCEGGQAMAFDQHLLSCLST